MSTAFPISAFWPLAIGFMGLAINYFVQGGTTVFGGPNWSSLLTLLSSVLHTLSVDPLIVAKLFFSLTNKITRKLHSAILHSPYNWMT